MLNSEIAFRDALDAYPEDDALRSAYAEWLERHEDPRAEGVRGRDAQIKRIREKFAQLKSEDIQYSVWAAQDHAYFLFPPLRPSLIRQLETRHGVRFPDDYFDFVSRIAEGGAGPSYGLRPLREVCHEDMREPFPLVAGADDHQGYDLPVHEWGRGHILVPEHGCGSEAYLVVSGSEAGKVWEFWGACDCLWHPTGMNFLAWYEAWLDAGLRKDPLLWRERKKQA